MKNLNNLTRMAVITLLMLQVCLICGCKNIIGSGVIVAGSTSVQPYAEILAEEFMLLHPEYEIDIQGGGSSAGITAAQRGTAEIGMSSRALKEKEQGLIAIEIAKDGLAIIIHPSNPISDLTLSQIRDIYTGNVKDWSKLGGKPAKIHVFAREEGSGTRTAFEDLVMDKQRITSSAIVQDSNGAVRQLVCGDPNSIGFISLGLVDNTVKALSLDGVVPTRENVMNGTYSLFRPFLFVVNQNPAGLVKKFIDFTLSGEGQQMLINEGLIAAAEGGK